MGASIKVNADYKAAKKFLAANHNHFETKGPSKAR
jgi:hypothetical protein